MAECRVQMSTADDSAGPLQRTAVGAHERGCLVHGFAYGREPELHDVHVGERGDHTPELARRL